MKAEYHCLVIVFVAAMLVVAGCKKKGSTVGGSGQATLDTKEIAAVRDALTSNMTKVAVDKLKPADSGKDCVVTLWAPDGGLQLDPPPPPLGMIRPMGQTIICSGQLDEIAADSITIRGAYPTSGTFKRIAIHRDTIQSFHLAR